MERNGTFKGAVRSEHNEGSNEGWDHINVFGNSCISQTHRLVSELNKWDCDNVTHISKADHHITISPHCDHWIKIWATCLPKTLQTLIVNILFWETKLFLIYTVVIIHPHFCFRNWNHHDLLVPVHLLGWDSSLKMVFLKYNRYYGQMG